RTAAQISMMRKRVMPQLYAFCICTVLGYALLLLSPLLSLAYSIPMSTIENVIGMIAIALTILMITMMGTMILTTRSRVWQKLGT
ncbi:hypothetical protein CL628_04320, partial [bacterium]|nr:hypothetical protein [bacterium]